MKLTNRLLALAGVCILAGPAAAAPITTSSLSQSSSTTSSATSVTLSLEAVGAAAGPNAFVDNEFPVGYTVGDATTCAGISLTVNTAPTIPVSCGTIGQTIYVEIGGGLAPGDDVEIIYASSLITNAATPGSKTYNFQTTTGSGVVDTGTANVVLAAPPAPVPTLGEWAMIILGTALAGFAALTIQRRRQFI